jgi:hypothetical protein
MESCLGMPKLKDLSIVGITIVIFSPQYTKNMPIVVFYSLNHTFISPIFIQNLYEMPFQDFKFRNSGHEVHQMTLGAEISAF